MNLFDDIAKDVQEYAKNVCKYSAIEVREELYQDAINAIDLFYDSYEPSYYHRTFNLYKSFKKWYKNNHDTTFTGGVILSPEFMDDIYRGSRELIFDLTYAGYHGLDSWNQTVTRPSSPYAVTMPSPMDYLIMRRDYYARNPELIINVGISKANREKYLTMY